jgi:hypothetical protein
MNLYLIRRIGEAQYDEYRGAVVCAENAATAARINPGTGVVMTTEDDWRLCSDWVGSENDVAVELIGTAMPHLPMCVVLADFKAG